MDSVRFVLQSEKIKAKLAHPNAKQYRILFTGLFIGLFSEALAE
jgi:hypothetical protein